MAHNSSKDYYLGNVNLPTKHTKIHATKEELQHISEEMEKCKKDIIYFAENYFYIVNPDEGLVKIKLYKFQKKFLKNIVNNRFVIFNTARQIGKSSLLTIFSLWYVLNNENKYVLLLANKEDTAIEIFSRIKKAYEELPNWLKPGVEKYDETKMALTNGSKITVSTTTPQAARGYTINVLMLDEFAFVECLDENTKISIRNKYNKVCEKINIGELYIRLKDKIDNISLNNIYEILTPTGWKNFKGISINYSTKCIKLTFNNNTSIICSKDHLFLDINNNFIKAQNMLNQTVLCNNNLIICTKIVDVSPRNLFDIIEIDDDEHIFYSNDIISHNCNIADNFFKSVYPTISASKTSKIIITSTPNGDNNIFYKLCQGAINNENGWFYDSVIWSDVPGRNQKWKEQTLSTMGSYESFAQEFEAVFISSKSSFLNEELIQRLKMNATPAPYVYENGAYKIWEMPIDSHIYVAGIDTSEGVNLDASTISILDITDLKNIKQIATYCNNNISPYEYSQKVYEILQQWGNPLALIERNNQGSQIVDRLINDYNYENIVSWGSSVVNRKYIPQGIISHRNVRDKAIKNMRYFLTEIQNVVINDIDTIEEFRNFVRYPNGTWSAKKGNYHDDRIMALVWSLFILHDEIVSTYFDVKSKDVNGVVSNIEPFKDESITYFTHNEHNLNKETNSNNDCFFIANTNTDTNFINEQEKLYNWLLNS